VGHTIVLALAAAVYPTILAAVIVILGRPHARQLLLGFLAGGMIMSVAAGLVVLWAIEKSGKVIDLKQTTRPAFDIAAGFLSLIVAWIVWTDRAGKLGVRRRQSKVPTGKPSLIQRVAGHATFWPMIFAGALLSLPSVWYLAALTEIATDRPTSYQVLQVLVFNAIMFVLVEVPVVLFLLDEAGARRRVAAFSAWIHAHAREVGTSVAGLAGAYLLTRGAIAS
jgi:hypothetical protein